MLNIIWFFVVNSALWKVFAISTTLIHNIINAFFIYWRLLFLGLFSLISASLFDNISFDKVIGMNNFIWQIDSIIGSQLENCKWRLFFNFFNFNRKVMILWTKALFVEHNIMIYYYFFIFWFIVLCSTIFEQDINGWQLVRISLRRSNLYMRPGCS